MGKREDMLCQTLLKPDPALGSRGQQKLLTSTRVPLSMEQLLDYKNMYTAEREQEESSREGLATAAGMLGLCQWHCMCKLPAECPQILSSLVPSVSRVLINYLPSIP